MHLLGAYGVVRILRQSSTHPGASNCLCKFEYTADAILPVNGNGEVASEQCEEADDRNADAEGYFLNGRSSLRTLSDRMDG